MSGSTTNRWLTWLPLTTLAVGPLLYTLHKALPAPLLGGFFLERSSISVVAATFSFTMLGFLAAIITLLFTLGPSRNFVYYKKRGYLKAFFVLYGVAIFSLFLTFTLAVVSFAAAPPPLLVRGVLMSLTNNVLQTLLITTAIMGLVVRAQWENEG